MTKQLRSKVSMASKVQLYVFLPLFVLGSALSALTAFQIREGIIEEKKHVATAVVESVRTVALFQYEAFKAGKISE